MNPRWLLLLLLLSTACFAHKQSDSYLEVRIDDTAVQVQWDIALRDLDFALGLDVDADDRITWGETRRRGDAIRDYAQQHLHLVADDSHDCPLRAGELLIDEHVDGTYAVLRFTGQCSIAPTRLGIAYSLLSGIDPNHRGLLELRSGAVTQSAVLDGESTPVWFDLNASNRWQQFRSFLVEGVHHIWLGFDHVLFLFTLLLPAVVVQRDGRWQPRASLRDSTLDIVKVVSAFTLAHSLTLSLAALGVVNLPSRLVESAIAVTVLLGALNILFPVVHERRWLLALGFGLIHGLGFASVLADLGLDTAHRIEALVGFNVGVELGQLAIVSLLMPAIFFIRGTAAYRQLLLPAGASAIGAVAVYWLIARAFPNASMVF